MATAGFDAHGARDEAGLDIRGRRPPHPNDPMGFDASGLDPGEEPLGSTSPFCCRGALERPRMRALRLQGARFREASQCCGPWNHRRL